MHCDIAARKSPEYSDSAIPVNRGRRRAPADGGYDASPGKPGGLGLALDDEDVVRLRGLDRRNGNMQPLPNDMNSSNRQQGVMHLLIWRSEFTLDL